MDSINNIVKKLRENRILNEKADYSNKSRNDLIKLAQSGDSLALDTLIKSHKDFINRMIGNKYYGEGADRDDIESLATEAFWNAVMNYDMSGDFEAFAGMKIKSRLIDLIRKNNTEKSNFNNTAAELDAPSTHHGDPHGVDRENTLGELTPSRDLSPEEQVIGNSGYDDIVKFMRDNLSDLELKAVFMRKDGYKNSEIAEVLGMSPKKIENAIGRVKGKLADYLRTRESKKIKESKGTDFTDEEKRILDQVMKRMNEDKERI